MATGLFAAPARAASGGSGDSGAGTAAAAKNPDCDPDTGRIKFPSLAAPLCVKEWKDGADNGGKTAQGVTKDTIKVVVLYADVVQDDRSPATLYRNQATGTFSNQRDTIIDADAVYAHAYETWGRKVEYEFVKGSGADETAQRADAIAVASKKPFAVFDAAIQGGNQSTGGLIFETVVEQKGVPLVLGTGRRAAAAARRTCRTGSPRTWPSSPASRSSGKKAEYGGDDGEGQDPELRHPLPGRRTGLRHRLLQVGVRQVRRQARAERRSRVHVPAGHVAGRRQRRSPSEQMPTLMAKLKDAGVTTIIEVLDARYGMRPGMLAATSAEYFPEWLIGSGGPTGGGAFPGDLPILVRTADKQQMAHAFGLIWSPALRGEPDGDQPLPVVLGNQQGQHLVGCPGDGRRDVLADPPRRARSHRGEDEARSAAVEARRRTVQQRASSRRRPDYDKNGNPIIDATLGWWSTDTTGFDPGDARRG